MKIDGWEWRTLPDNKARLCRWLAADGVWLVLGRAMVMVATGWEEIVGEEVRPLSCDGVVFSWDEWMEATHPTAPDGWEQIRGWAKQGSHRGIVGDCRYLNAAGEIVDEIPAGEWGALVRPVAPPVTWADVPAGVEVNGNGTVTRDGCHIGWIRQNTQRQPCVWEWGAFENFETKHRGDHVKFVAAIVALLKAAGGEG